MLEAPGDAVSLGLGRGEPLPLAEAAEQREGGGDREGESRADGERLPAAPAVGVGSAGEAEGDSESERGPEAEGEAEGEGVTRAALAVGAPSVRVPTREPVAFALAVPEADTERVVEPAPLREVLTQTVPVASAGVPLCEDDASRDAEGEPLTPALPEGDPDAEGEPESGGEREGDSEKDAVPVDSSEAAAERLNVGEVVPLPRDVALPPPPDDSEGEGVMGPVASWEALPLGEREGVIVLLVKVEPEVEAIASAVTVTEGGGELLLEGEPVSLSLCDGERVNEAPPLVEGDTSADAEKEADTEGERETPAETVCESGTEAVREMGGEREGDAVNDADRDTVTLLVSEKEPDADLVTAGERV